MVLENKLGLCSEAELAREEERLSKARAARLFEQGLLDKLDAGTFAALASIHRFLFSEIYAFAGTIRKTNLAKGYFRFVPVLYLEDALRRVESMPQETFAEIVDNYVEMNVVHPFREGNGRSMRIWLNVMLKKRLGVVVDWSLIARDDYLSAMERSPINSAEIKALLRGALTGEVTSGAVYMRGIDASYHYEGYCRYRTRDLSRQ